jgi:hypothetical protein
MGETDSCQRQRCLTYKENGTTTRAYQSENESARERDRIERDEDNDRRRQDKDRKTDAKIFKMDTWS